jgi:hypothetical protein
VAAAVDPSHDRGTTFRHVLTPERLLAAYRILTRPATPKTCPMSVLAHPFAHHNPKNMQWLDTRVAPCYHMGQTF